ncbi:uncharacterized protein [Clinocottus analis]|uniref:uncharacterized protein n=1 Tax=Clinocottus analis TaxID=304258 RepID=UPI0035C10EC0
MAMQSGTRSLVSVHQPPVLTTALGQDVVMPCHLQHSRDDKMASGPVLYWNLIQNDTDSLRVFPSDKYEGRVELLDNSRTTLNKSIVLKNVQWADSGKYLCKLSITMEGKQTSRKKGNETSLKVYDTMIFNLTAHNDSLLQCEVNVTPDPGFVLFILHNGLKLPPADSAPGEAGASLPYVTLSETIPLRSEGEYECQLHLNRDLITKSIFVHLPVADDGGDAAIFFALTSPTTVSGVVVFPEPWLLYMALLLVPITILLSLVTALLVYRC